MKASDWEGENLADKHPDIVYDMQNIVRRVKSGSKTAK